MFSMYVSLLAVQYYLEKGGIEELRKANEIKQRRVYEALDEGVQAGVFHGKVQAHSRSWMNVTFVLSNSDAEKRFLEEAQQIGLRGVKGHRSVGGIRFSIYNAVTESQVDTIVAFMRKFIQNEVAKA
ncbi:Phosphoserine transaminase [Tulasnella sp. 403]|nr:Phosphoserine transaminase [Tulasnella sp. 403]